MDPTRFDALTRALTGPAPSRRRLLTGVAGGALGTVAALLGFADADAHHFGCVHVGKRCKRSGQCCSSRCRGPRGEKTCRAHDVDTCTAAKDACITAAAGCGGGSCFCLRTTGRANFCSEGAIECRTCTTDAQCVRALGVDGAACITADYGECTCNTTGTACVRPCTA